MNPWEKERFGIRQALTVVSARIEGSKVLNRSLARTDRVAGGVIELPEGRAPLLEANFCRNRRKGPLLGPPRFELRRHLVSRLSQEQVVRSSTPLLARIWVT